MKRTAARHGQFRSSRMRTPRAILLDFYGTVVEEDDAAISSVVRTILDDPATRPASASRIGHEWWRSFSALCAPSPISVCVVSGAHQPARLSG